MAPPPDPDPPPGHMSQFYTDLDFDMFGLSSTLELPSPDPEQPEISNAELDLYLAEYMESTGWNPESAPPPSQVMFGRSAQAMSGAGPAVPTAAPAIPTASPAIPTAAPAVSRSAPEVTAAVASTAAHSSAVHAHPTQRGDNAGKNGADARMRDYHERIATSMRTPRYEMPTQTMPQTSAGPARTLQGYQQDLVRTLEATRNEIQVQAATRDTENTVMPSLDRPAQTTNTSAEAGGPHRNSGTTTLAHDNADKLPDIYQRGRREEPQSERSTHPSHRAANRSRSASPPREIISVPELSVELRSEVFGKLQEEPLRRRAARNERARVLASGTAAPDTQRAVAPAGQPGTRALQGTPATQNTPGHHGHKGIQQAPRTKTKGPARTTGRPATTALNNTPQTHPPNTQPAAPPTATSATTLLDTLQHQIIVAARARQSFQEHQLRLDSVKQVALLRMTEGGAPTKPKEWLEEFQRQVIVTEQAKRVCEREEAWLEVLKGNVAAQG